MSRFFNNGFQILNLLMEENLKSENWNGEEIILEDRAQVQPIDS